MKAPLNLDGAFCGVTYPSSIFSLEHHEIIVFERFAYNIFREAVSALAESYLPAELDVEFPSSGETPAWALNCSIQASNFSAGMPTKVRVCVPQLLPPLLMWFSTSLCKGLFSNEGIQTYSENSELLHQDIQQFFDRVSAVVREFREHGLAFAIRLGHELFETTFDTIDKSFDQFDSLSYLIANHEISHLYIGQFSKQATSFDDQKSYELISDLVAVEWLYRRYVLFTPDTDDYRKRRNLRDHPEAIFLNSRGAIETLLGLLLIMGSASAQVSNGRFHFEAGRVHPGSFVRYYVQHLWLMGAIEGDFKALLDDKYRQLLKLWSDYFGVLCESGTLLRIPVNPTEETDMMPTGVPL